MGLNSSERMCTSHPLIFWSYQNRIYLTHILVLSVVFDKYDPAGPILKKQGCGLIHQNDSAPTESEPVFFTVACW